MAERASVEVRGLREGREPGHLARRHRVAQAREVRQDEVSIRAHAGVEARVDPVGHPPLEPPAARRLLEVRTHAVEEHADLGAHVPAHDPSARQDRGVSAPKLLECAPPRRPIAARGP